MTTTGFTSQCTPSAELGNPHLRILHSYKIFRPDIIGGIPEVIAMLTRDRSFTHSIVTARRHGPGAKYQQGDADVSAATSYGTLFSMPIAPAFIGILARKLRFCDVIIHHAPFPIADAAFLAFLPPHVALIVYWHADAVGFPKLNRLINPLISRTLRRADCIIVSGENVLESTESLQAFRAKTFILPYGIDTSFWSNLPSSEAPLIAELKEQQPRRILAIGRLVPYKGFDVLIRALQTVDAHLTIVGEGQLHTPLRQLAISCGVLNRVSFVGCISREVLRRYIHASNVLAFPSTTGAEAFGLVQVEAMAAGLPIVNTSLPTNVPFVSRHLKEALTVSPGDAVSLSSALSQILNDNALALRLRMGGLSRAADFDCQKYLRCMGKIYYDAIQFRLRTLAHDRPR